MSCYKPNFIVKWKVDRASYMNLWFRHHDDERFGWKFPKDTKKGRFLYRFMTGYDYDNFKNRNEYDIEDYDVVQVPCGCCIGCRLDYSRQWANRCYLESLGSKDTYFITLTYDDEHLPKGSLGNSTLIPDDLKKFIKDLRAYYKYHYNLDNIRYFACGEYGDISMRSHYHLIMFNLPIFDLDSNFIYEENGQTYITQHVQNGYVYKYSDIIHKIWNKGNILIGDATWQSMAYVARYVTKKLKGKDAEVYEALGIEPEFVRMSRMPGLGEEYFKNHYKEIYENDNVVIFNGKNANVCQPPRYFDKLVEKYELSDIDLKAIKDYRISHSEDAQKSIDMLSNCSYLDYIDSLEEKKKRQISSLKRCL